MTMTMSLLRGSSLASTQDDTSSAYNFATRGGTHAFEFARAADQPHPLPALSARPDRNGGAVRRLSNVGILSKPAKTTMAVVAVIRLGEWPALLGRAVFFAVEANIRTNLTGLSLAIDTGGSDPAGSSGQAGGGWSLSHKMIAYSEQVGVYSTTSYQAVLCARSRRAHTATSLSLPLSQAGTQR